MTLCAVVTGGSSNIGQGTAIVLAEHGYDVAITYAKNKAGANKTKQQIESLGRRCFVYKAHLQNPDEVVEMIHRAYDDLGRLDCLVCNAGRESRKSILTTTVEELDFLYDNTLRNYLLCIGTASRIMVKEKIQGSIVMMTSMRARVAHSDGFLYSSFKAAMEQGCKSIALDLSEFNIRVNCVAPGAIWPPDWDNAFIRESIPLHRSGTPRDVGEAVAFLAGEKSSYITGTTILVDGGLSLPVLLEQDKAIPWKYEGWSEQRYEEAMELLEKEKDSLIRKRKGSE